jgi:hypothetical protein
MCPKRVLPVFAILLCAAALHAQSSSPSLGDVARQQHNQQAQKPAAPHKVITDDDIPSHPAETEPASSEKGPAAGSHAGAINSESSGGQLKAQFAAQKQKIRNFEQQLNELKASVHYVEANRYSNGVQYNQAQLHRQQEAERMQKQLDEAKKTYAEMQEKARKAGFGSSVYDPQ